MPTTFFDTQQVVIELKILGTEFGEAKSFLAKEQSILREAAQRFPFGQIVRFEKPVRKFYSRKKLELYRSPLSRIAKKANRQIRETKRALGVANHRGVLWLVNDGFRKVGAELVFSIMCRILMGSNSQIRALIYCTNHYVSVPGNPNALLLWRPVYADHAADDLPDFVNWLGCEWHNFLEKEIGPFEYKFEGPDDSVVSGARPIVHPDE